MCFVVVLNVGGKKFYLSQVKRGILDPHTKKPIEEARGVFSESSNDAIKYGKEWLAEAVSASYSDSYVEKYFD